MLYTREELQVIRLLSLSQNINGLVACLRFECEIGFSARQEERTLYLLEMMLLQESWVCTVGMKY